MRERWKCISSPRAAKSELSKRSCAKRSIHVTRGRCPSAARCGAAAAPMRPSGCAAERARRQRRRTRAASTPWASSCAVATTRAARPVRACRRRPRARARASRLACCCARSGWRSPARRRAARRKPWRRAQGRRGDRSVSGCARASRRAIWRGRSTYESERVRAAERSQARCHGGRAWIERGAPRCSRRRSGDGRATSSHQRLAGEAAHTQRDDASCTCA